MIFDTHSHLFEPEFDNDRDDCFQRLKEIDGKVMLVGFNVRNNQEAYDLAKKYNMWSSAGLHPDEAFDDIDEKLNKLKDFIKTHKVYAIGECGLDFHYEPYDHAKQVRLFDEQLKLAEEYDLPIIIHSRDANQETFDMIKKYEGKVKGIMHCYSGSLEMAREYIKMGWYISLGGPVTFKNSKEAKRIATEIPLDRLLIETDCPYLAPVPFRGTRNESSYVIYTAREIASLRNISLEEVEKETYKNALKIFKIEE